MSSAVGVYTKCGPCVGVGGGVGGGGGTTPAGPMGVAMKPGMYVGSAWGGAAGCDRPDTCALVSDRATGRKGDQ